MSAFGGAICNCLPRPSTVRNLVYLSPGSSWCCAGSRFSTIMKCTAALNRDPQCMSFTFIAEKAIVPQYTKGTINRLPPILILPPSKMEEWSSYLRPTPECTVGVVDFGQPLTHHFPSMSPSSLILSLLSALLGNILRSFMISLVLFWPLPITLSSKTVSRGAFVALDSRCC